MKRLIIILLLTLSILEVSEGIFRKKKTGDGTKPLGDGHGNRIGKGKGKKKGKYTTTESPIEDLEPSLPKPGESVLPGPHDPSSVSEYINKHFGPILDYPDPEPPPSNCGLAYFPVNQPCSCPRPHGDKKKPRRRLFGCFGGGGSSSEEGGRGCYPKHKGKHKPKGPKNGNGKVKKRKGEQNSFTFD